MKKNNKLIKQVKTLLPTQWGNFQIIAYAKSDDEAMPQLALVHEKFDPTVPTYLRIHSECLTGDIFGSKRCDCGEQLHAALTLAAEKSGVVLYLRQEGRGIGLIPKLKAYNIKSPGINTADANTHLGFEVDSRQYDCAIRMLQDLGISRVHLMTNNPDKLQALKNSPIEVLSRVPLVMPVKKENEAYLRTKRDLMGHLL